MQDIISKLNTSTNALFAVGLALQAKVNEDPLDKEFVATVYEVLEALGVTKALNDLEPRQAASLLAEIRGDLLLGAQTLGGPSAVSGWAHANADLLQSFGDVSAGFPSILASRIAPTLDGLADRLEAPGAAFLDIGVGVAALSIAMVRRWPSLRVVGVDPWPTSISIGQQNAREAKLADRIELLEKPAEAIDFIDEFDLAWVPSAFIPQMSLPVVLERVRQALKPGGWVLLARVNYNDEPVSRAVARFRTVLWGGNPLLPEDAEALLSAAGFGTSRQTDVPPGAPITVTAAQYV